MIPTPLRLRPVAPPTHAPRVAALPAFPSGPVETLGHRGRDYLASRDAEARAFHHAGASGLSTCRLLTASADHLVRGLWDALSPRLPAQAEVALLALGGYGRRELSPHSDLDLLLLHDSGLPEREVQPFAEALSTVLWDLKRTVALGVRTPEDCAQAALEDHTLRTALLDARLLAGSGALAERLAGLLRTERTSSVASAFLDAKIAELSARRQRFGGTLYVLEPNLKQGEGGLRDLDALRWLGNQRFRAPSVAELLRLSILSPQEAADVRAARDVLLRARHELHWLRGRKDDRLTFEHQVAVAEALGYRGGAHELPVEQFMRDYYLAATILRRAADAMVARILAERTRLTGPTEERRLGSFRVLRGRLLLGRGTPDLADSPARVLELFQLAEAEQLELDPVTRGQVTAALPALETHRGDPAVVAALQSLLTRPGTRGELLFELHELGVLGALLPEFGRILAQHQHDAYHLYTTDVHSLFALRRLQLLRAGELQEEAPTQWRRMRTLEDPLPLYLGMLYHDVGKGLGGDHALKGRALMAQAGERLGLTPRQREIAEFLVLEHLLMSHTSQRRDLSDPELIRDFAARCGDLEKLTCLFLLTWADISSVGPQMWTAWRAQLLEELYVKARAVLLGLGPEGPLSGKATRQACLSSWTPLLGEARARALLASLPGRYFATSPDPARARLDARLLERARRAPLAAILRQRPGSEPSELILATRDRPGLLSLLAGVLSAHRIHILSARIVTTADGLALDAFDVRASPGTRLERGRWRAARADLRLALEGRLDVEARLARQRESRLYSQPLPRVRARVTVDNRASRTFSVVDVRAEDRVGLLHAVAAELAAAGLEIGVAKVSTEANRATDSFYVTRGGAKLVAGEVESLVTRLEAVLERESDPAEPTLPGS